MRAALRWLREVAYVVLVGLGAVLIALGLALKGERER